MSKAGSSISTTASIRHGCNLFELIDVRMGDYIQRLLGVDAVEARRVQKGYFHAHGTTLAGLMAEHGVDPHDFLDFVHDIDLARLDRRSRAWSRRWTGCRGASSSSPTPARIMRGACSTGSASPTPSTACTTSTPWPMCPSPIPPPMRRSATRHAHRSGARPVRRRHGPQPRPGQGARHDHLVGRQRLGAGTRRSPSPTSSITGRPISPAGWQAILGEEVA